MNHMHEEIVIILFNNQGCLKEATKPSEQNLTPK